MQLSLLTSWNNKVNYYYISYLNSERSEVECVILYREPVGGENRSKCIDRITGLEFTEVSRLTHDEKENLFSKLGGTAQLRPCMIFSCRGFFMWIFKALIGFQNLRRNWNG